MTESDRARSVGERILAQAGDALVAGDYHRTRELVEQVLAVEPENAEAVRIRKAADLGIASLQQQPAPPAQRSQSPSASPASQTLSPGLAAYEEARFRQILVISLGVLIFATLWNLYMDSDSYWDTFRELRRGSLEWVFSGGLTNWLTAASIVGIIYASLRLYLLTQWPWYGMSLIAGVGEAINVFFSNIYDARNYITDIWADWLQYMNFARSDSGQTMFSLLYVAIVVGGIFVIRQGLQSGSIQGPAGGGRTLPNTPTAQSGSHPAAPARPQDGGPITVRYEDDGSIPGAIFWMSLISMFLFWLPLFGGLIAGFVGGRVAGGLSRALTAVFAPMIVASIAIYLIVNSMTDIPFLGAVTAGIALFVMLAHSGPMLVGAIIGGATKS